MEDETRLHFNSNGSGVILRLSIGDISYRSTEFQLYQSLFRICDVQTLGSIHIHSPCLHDLILGTKLEMNLFKKLISISATQIYKRALELDSATSATSAASSLNSNSTIVPDLITFHHWLLLCKLIAAVQQQQQQGRKTQNLDLSTPQAEKQLLVSVLDHAESPDAGGFTAKAPIAPTHGINGKHPSNHQQQHHQEQINISPRNTRIANFSLCSMTHTLPQYNSGGGPGYLCDIIGWEYTHDSADEQTFQQQHVKFKIQTQAAKRPHLFEPTLSIVRPAISSVSSAAENNKMTKTRSQSEQPVDSVNSSGTNNNTSNNAAGNNNWTQIKKEYKTSRNPYDNGFDFMNHEDDDDDDNDNENEDGNANNRSGNDGNDEAEEEEEEFYAQSRSQTLSNSQSQFSQSQNKRTPSSSSSTPPTAAIVSTPNGATESQTMDPFMLSPSSSSAASTPLSSSRTSSHQTHTPSLSQKSSTRGTENNSNAFAPAEETIDSQQIESPGHNNFTDTHDDDNEDNEEDEDEGHGRQTHTIAQTAAHNDGQNQDHEEDNDNTHTIVYRRFSDFEKLVEVLQSSYPGVIIPPLPPKTPQWGAGSATSQPAQDGSELTTSHAGSAQNTLTHMMSVTGGLILSSFRNYKQRHSDVLLHQRARDLKLFLDAVCCHRVLRHSFEVRVFVEASTKGYRAFKELFPRFVRGEVKEDVHAVGLKATIAEVATSAVSSALGVVQGIWGSVANNISVNYGNGGSNGYVYSSSPPATSSGNNGLLSYFQGVGLGMGASTGNAVTNSISTVIDVVKQTTANPNAQPYNNNILKGNNNSTMFGYNPVLDQHTQRLHKSLVHVARSASILENWLTHDNSRLYEMSQFSYYLKLLSELDMHAQTAQLKEMASSGVWTATDTDTDTDVDIDGDLVTIIKPPTQQPAPTRHNTSQHSATTSPPPQYAQALSHACTHTAATIDSVAMSQQKYLETQHFRCLGSLLYVGRYTHTVAQAHTQRQDAVTAIETACEDRTVKKELLDAGRTTEGTTEHTLARLTEQYQAAEVEVQRVKEEEIVTSSTLSNETSVLASHERAAIAANMTLFAKTRLASHARDVAYWTALLDVLQKEV